MEESSGELLTAIVLGPTTPKTTFVSTRACEHILYWIHGDQTIALTHVPSLSEILIDQPSCRINAWFVASGYCMQCVVRRQHYSQQLLLVVLLPRVVFSAGSDDRSPWLDGPAPTGGRPDRIDDSSRSTATAMSLCWLCASLYKQDSSIIVPRTS